MVCFCPCCPIYRCALWFCFVEVVVSLYTWFKALDLVVKTFEEIQIHNFLALLILTGWVITLFTSTGCLIAAQRKKSARYTLPRIIQLSGLLAVGLALILFLAAYFSGASTRVNGWFVAMYEHYTQSEMSKTERREYNDSVKYYMMGAIPLVFAFICYVGLALAVTRRYRTGLVRDYGRDGGGGQARFHRVEQGEPMAVATNAPPAYNPTFAKGV